MVPKRLMIFQLLALLIACPLVMGQPTSNQPAAKSKKPQANQPDKQKKAAASERQGIEFFEKKIRPVLANQCYECHSAKAESAEGGLVLDSREGIRRGGESGHAVVPGNLDESLILTALRHEDLQMPPEEKLSDQVIADFVRWIEMGAPDPREATAPLIRREIDFDEARQFWAFQPIASPQPPKSSAWARGDIDRFIEHQLQEAKLRPAADAQPHVLVRRIYFDLIGLPPTPEQVAQYVADPSPQATAELIDRLLDSPQFGERWGRHWLDVVRYAESTGMERNFTYPYAWRYRDYVISSFNEDKPFDQFCVEQIAGDLMPAKDPSQRRQQLIATGMLAIGTKSLNETNREKFAMDVVDEQIDVTTQAFLGMTAACARCHDHKFDPIPTKEYYALAGIFRSTTTLFGTGGNGNRNAGKLLAIAKDDSLVQVAPAGGNKRNQNNVKKFNNQLRAARKRLQQLQNAKKKNETQIARLEAQIKRLQRQIKQNKAPAAAAKTPDGALLVMAVQDGNASDTEVRIRGEANQRGDSVPRGFLTIATMHDPASIPEDGSGRMQLAEWMVDSSNPLTARVAVNRIWQHLLGQGIVPTVNNFGMSGERPSHPELLDYLAHDFQDNGWSFKHTIRQIMNSRVYQLSSSSSEKVEAVDPANRLFSHANQRRLEAEAIRDSLLFVSGELDLNPATGSIVEKVGNGNVGRTIQPNRLSTTDNKRSVYLPIVRGVVPEFLSVFDFPDPSIIFGAREVTTVPTQALYMMNSEFVLERSTKFAQRLLEQSELDQQQRIQTAFQWALGRQPTDVEANRLAKFIDSMCGEDADSEAREMAWASACQVLFASSEFRYVN